MNMSSNLATCNVFFVLSTDASASQAGAPSVLPPRWISVMFSEAMRGFRWDSMCSSVSSLRERPVSVKMVEEAMVEYGMSCLGDVRVGEVSHLCKEQGRAWRKHRDLQPYENPVPLVPDTALQPSSSARLPRDIATFGTMIGL